jgi:imidazolonepropionase-like amidohydrolase
MDVLIENNTISAIEPTGALETDSYVISGEGATLVPGLIDMHAHLEISTGPSWEFSFPDPEGSLLAYAYSGVTTIFDVGDSSDDAYTRRAKVASGELIGPRIYTAGRIITHPEGHPLALVEELAPWWIKWYIKPKVATGVASKEEAIAAVNERIDAGADAIKIAVDSIPLDAPKLAHKTITEIVTQAKTLGIRTVAHIGTTEDALVTGESGVALWVHGVYKERIPDDKIKQLVAYNIPMVPTSEVFDRYGRASEGPIKVTKMEQETVAQTKLDSFYPIPENFDPGALRSWAELMQVTRGIRRENVGRLHRAGMTILPGSDSQSGVFPGAGYHRELVSLVAAGMSPAQVIRAATLDSANYLANGEVPTMGTIEVGKRADLILVEGDPSQDINVLANIREVILDGKVLLRSPVPNSASH